MKIITKWTKHPRIPLDGLELWTPSFGTSENAVIYDHSGNDRNLSGGGGVQQANKLNGLPAHYLDGADTPYSVADDFTIKHGFIVASHEAATFNDNDGLISTTTQRILDGQASSDKFAANGHSDFVYKKSDIEYISSNQKAPVDSTFAVIEFQFKNGLEVSNFQIGQRLTTTSDRWKGWVFDLLLYSKRKNFNERIKIYQYFSQVAHLWRETSGGNKIFPFLNNHASSHRANQYTIQSDALPNGLTKKRVKGTRRKSFEFSFTNRSQEEIDAVDKFESEFEPTNEIFSIENNSVYPFRRYNVRFDSIIEKQNRLINQGSYKVNVTQSDLTEEEVFELDLTPPSIPPNFTATGQAGGINWSWAASQDNIEVDEYEIEISAPSSI